MCLDTELVAMVAASTLLAALACIGILIAVAIMRAAGRGAGRE